MCFFKIVFYFQLVPAVSLKKKFYLSQYKCPEIEEKHGKMKCTWRLDTAPIYRQSVPEYYFSLKAENVFGNYTMPKMLFKHFQHGELKESTK